MKILAILVSLIICGCQSSSVTLESKYTHSVKTNAQDSNFCQFHLDSYTDLRNSKSLGVVAGTVVDTDIEPRLLGAFLHLNINKKNINQFNGVRINLIKAYVTSVSSSMAANVVISIEYKKRSDEIYQTKNIYRGRSVLGNWSSGEGEISLLLNKAIGKMVRKIKTDIAKHCNNEVFDA